MASNYTTNYQLNQWEPTDAVQRVEFNQDNAKVDAALKALSDQVVQKANQSALNTLISAVNQKANQSDLTAAVNRISAVEGGRATKTELNQVNSTLTAKADALDAARCLDRLLDYTVPSDTAAVNLDLSQISVSDYASLLLIIYAEAYSYLRMRINGLSTENYLPLSISTDTSHANDGMYLLYGGTSGGTMYCTIAADGIDGDRIICSITGGDPGGNNGFSISGWRVRYLSFEQIVTLNLFAELKAGQGGSPVIRAGSRFRVFGLR